MLANAVTVTDDTFEQEVGQSAGLTLVDFSATWKVNDMFEIYTGIDNAFDEDPPLLTSSWGGDANTDVTLYDVIGRRYFLGMRANF